MLYYIEQSTLVCALATQIADACGIQGAIEPVEETEESQWETEWLLQLESIMTTKAGGGLVQYVI